MSGDGGNEFTDQEWTEMFAALVDLPTSQYVRFDEREDVLSSLELLTVIAPHVQLRPQLWKWIIVGAQSALQGAMVCALVDSTGTSVLKKKSAIQLLDWLQADDSSGDPPKVWLEDFDRLLEKCETELGLHLGHKEREDICQLHSYFRNSFIHFIPRGWGIEKAGLPRIVSAAIDAVERLMAMERTGVRLEEFQSERLRSSLRDIRAALAAYPKSLVSEGS